MSRTQETEPDCGSHPAAEIELIVRGRPRDLGGFVVRRVLPSARRRLVGPFIFFDHMGPVDMPPGDGLDVRPHPHIALATVTYLFEGEIFHRDSLGSAQAIVPGDVNWMVAGHGIVHSERTSPERRASGQRLNGIQAWVALPEHEEECQPAFFHHAASTLPQLDRPGVQLRVIAGNAYGVQSPVTVSSPMFYVDAQLQDGAELEIDEQHPERAVYVASGAIDCVADVFSEGDMIVLAPGAHVKVRARGNTRVLLIGGAPLGERFIFWNFVASDPERIEQAKRDWQAERFPTVPGDELERIPLPT